MFKKINICSLGFFNYDQVISILGVEHVRTRDRCRNVGLKPLTGNPAYGWVTRSPDVEGAQPSTHIILKIIGKPSTASSYFSPLLLPLPLSSDSSSLSSTLLSLVRLLFHPPLYPICSLLFCSFHSSLELNIKMPIVNRVENSYALLYNHCYVRDASSTLGLDQIL